MDSKDKGKSKLTTEPDTPVENLKSREIVEEMRSSYLDYAMSVIVQRALPDVRDGLKPVHRRILYAMQDQGLRSSSRYRKSAQVVGRVMGHYHPHGDSAIYDSMVRMAQNFAMRYELVDGQGNFGSIDGDSAAAMRYTEARMTRIADEILADIDKDTVDFIDNYDGSTKEPAFLPAKIPNLLMNGSVGIAVGMATNIPPHNLSELIDGLTFLIENPEAGVDQLIDFVKGPDFPTGGTIYNARDIRQAYATGKGPVIIRGTAEIVENKGNFQIIISEIPYQVNKSKLIEKIAALVKDKKLEGIKDLRDESDKEGIRIALDLKKDAFPKKILNGLYKYTELQKAFHFNMLALVNGIQPQILSLKSILEEFIEHRRLVVIRRSKFELKKAQERAHILEGLSKALDNIDKVIETIKKSKTKEEAQINLIAKFKFSELQARAILEMRLQSLAGLERKKIEDELAEKQRLIKELTELLKSVKKILGVVKSELVEIKKNYGDERRTKIIKSAIREIGDEELVPEEDSLFMLTRDGYIKRVDPAGFKTQKRGGKGLIGMTTKDEDSISQFFVANTHDDILFFTGNGRVFQTKGYEVPVSSRTAKGRAIVNFLDLGKNDTITAVIPITKENSGQFLIMTTAQGVVKRLKIEALKNVRSSGLIAINLNGEDKLKWVHQTSGQDEVVIVSSDGNAIRFKESDVRAMGRTAAGVIGMRLEAGVQVVGMEVVGADNKNPELLVVMENGYGKRTGLKNYKLQKRGGKGILTAKINTKTGPLVSAHITTPEDEEIIAVSKKGVVIKTNIVSISVLGRATQGVRIMKINAGDGVASVVVI
ncbi:MAG: DNA gyrase subunit A [Candidatus Yanofskybacteria bacterium CG10_big_fil_rev_8_21_14_0_10_46_23]|uniref:DNA gyrase subunit A n=1 Tax=Candidatus Yanofskybacteria bacterium CG10_big_fil_rev_8_21_14_0_10_46_23 TaxID=1975098 RepID=A0A2H0R3H3_9BACT|nr:MAG: DNA gyrase subunit A [Candidatus Yanofskybacteria bacterium CG10_big_fil_rev_8_21_14_0_10_46_23]